MRMAFPAAAVRLVVRVSFGGGLRAGFVHRLRHTADPVIFVECRTIVADIRIVRAFL